MTRVIRWFKRHKKFLAATATMVGGYVNAACTDDRISSEEWQVIGWAIAGAVAVYFARNDDPPTTPESDVTPRDGIPTPVR